MASELAKAIEQTGVFVTEAIINREDVRTVYLIECSFCRLIHEMEDVPVSRCLCGAEPDITQITLPTREASMAALMEVSRRMRSR